jgi:hypothetical protein
VDVHYRQHWIRRIEAKLTVSLAEPRRRTRWWAEWYTSRLLLAVVGAACWC